MQKTSLFLAWAAAFVALAAAAAPGDRPFDFDSTPGKLPKDVRPVAYRIDLVPDLDRLTFAATEEVDIDATKPAEAVTLNTLGLAFADVTLKGEDAVPVAVAVDDKAQTATFRFPHPLAAGRHTLRIAFSGTIPTRPSGLYHADYDAGGGQKRMLTTQFEETDARRMFPCWDEPAFKATFTLSTTLPAGFRAISNTPIAQETTIGANRKKVTFATTPRMSSYLLVLVAGAMDRVERNAGDVRVGVDMIEGKADQGRYALDAATQLLPYYDDYFGVNYPLPKLDLIAIPGNFAAGAMENWGGITFIDSALLFDPAHSSPRTRESVYKIIAHEMAHQWTGDLVTMGWWSDIWLNEGFASWMEEKAADHFNPSWQVWLRAHDDKELAMEMDARPTTHPIQQALLDESEIQGAFDGITYEKGESFIRMLEDYLGEDVFRDGMRRYMKAHAYSNATTADLWAALTAASGKPVAEIATGFTRQPGVPLVRVATRCVGGNTIATLTQDRFTVHDPKPAPERWRIPVALGRPGDAASKRLLLEDTPQTVTFAGCGFAVKANYGDVGYYRSEYDAADLNALVAAYDTLGPADRVNLLADLYAMVEAGRADAGAYLSLSRKLASETELVVWTEAAAAFDEMDDVARGSPDRAALRAYARSIFRPAFDRIGWTARPGEAAETPLLRTLLIRELGRYGDPDVIAEARRWFQAFLGDPASLPADLQDPVMTVVGRAADQRTFDALHRLARAASSTEEKLRFYYALGSASDPALVEQAVKIATLSDEVPNGRVNRYVAAIANDGDDPDLVWKTFLPMRKSVEDRLNDRQRDTLMPLVASASDDDTTADALKALPEATASAGARRETVKAVEEITFHADFRQRLLPSISQWLKNNTGAAGARERAIQ